MTEAPSDVGGAGVSSSSTLHGESGVSSTSTAHHQKASPAAGGSPQKAASQPQQRGEQRGEQRGAMHVLCSPTVNAQCHTCAEASTTSTHGC